MEMLRLDERNPSFAHEEELAAEFTDEENAAHDDAATDDLASSTCSTSSQSSSEGDGSTESAPTPTCDGPAAACSPVALPASPTETCTSNEEAARKLHVVDATGEDTRIDAGGLLFKGDHVAFVHPRMEARFSASLYRDALPLHMAILCTILALRLRWMLDVALSAEAVSGTHWALTLDPRETPPATLRPLSAHTLHARPFTYGAVCYPDAHAVQCAQVSISPPLLLGPGPRSSSNAVFLPVPTQAGSNP